jgi:DNA invertase Pin-like site-specific DNA recombinase
MDRPALARLLAAARTGKVDVIVVYKVDRLTRSLVDFARMVELFDANGVSFVSVTQQFNTTTSMGRLTLNVLLSFAQFEREVTGERIRDKIAASKKKGLWMGGLIPLGYDLKDRALVVNQPEAETVRTLFRLYRELGTVRRLKVEADRRGLRTKRRPQASGKVLGGGLSSPAAISTSCSRTRSMPAKFATRERATPVSTQPLSTRRRSLRCSSSWRRTPPTAAR